MRKDTIPPHVVARNSFRILALGIATAMIAGGIGVLIYLLQNPSAAGEVLFGWWFMGVILFGFPLVMMILLPRQRRQDREPRL